MNFGVLGFDAWYNIAYLRIGGVLEMTAPIGIVIASWLLWRGIRRVQTGRGAA